MNFLILIAVFLHIRRIMGEGRHKQSLRSASQHLNSYHNSSDLFFEDFCMNDLERRHKIHCEESTRELQEGRNALLKYFNISDVKSKFYWQNFWQANYEPTWTCPFERRMGRRSDGGKWVCDPHKIFAKKSCIVYSVGSNDRFDFEEAIHDAGNHCEIHTFEIKTNNTRVPYFINFHQLEISATTAAENKKSLYTIMDDLNHTDTVIDILKFDADGVEYSIFTPSLFTEISQRRILVRQILIEVHPYPGTTATILKNVRKLFSTFNDNNYAIFHKEPNIILGNHGKLVEFALLKLPDDLKCNSTIERHL